MAPFPKLSCPMMRYIHRWSDWQVFNGMIILVRSRPMVYISKIIWVFMLINRLFYASRNGILGVGFHTQTAWGSILIGLLMLLFQRRKQTQLNPLGVGLFRVKMEDCLCFFVKVIPKVYEDATFIVCKTSFSTQSPCSARTFLGFGDHEISHWGMAEILDHLRRSFPTLSFHRTGSVVAWSWKARMPGKQDINAALMQYLYFSLQRRGIGMYIYTVFT